nr:immunoglobulin light chain junction region [Macaca mulatta]
DYYCQVLDSSSAHWVF